MVLARIDGRLVSSHCHPSMRGCTVVLCTPVDETGKDTGAPFAAIDPLGAGLHQRVMITTDGSHTQNLTGDDSSPLRNQVLGILDN